MISAVLSLSSLCTLLLAPPADASPTIVPGAAIDPAVPWAIAPDDGPRGFLESIYGVPVDTSKVQPIRQGTLMFDAESLAADVLDRLDLPLPALDHEPTPGILYLSMDGVQLKPICNKGQQANAALNCSPLVDGVTDFPKVVGGDATKQVVFEKLSIFYGDYDLVLTMNRPPPYLPYTMAVIGGSAENAGQGGGVCGIANVACDGAKRNHVSLSFPSSCPGDTAEIAAQETAHNWGLEHTDVQADLMYPFVAGGSSFRDECMPISHDTGSGTTQCKHVHEVYCPAGGGEQQNSHGELMGVFGPRTPDAIAPTIVSILPADGSAFTTADDVQVTASISENSNFVGVRWTWLEGLPAEIDEYTRCTNQVCTDDFAYWRPVDEPWDFLTLEKPPAGTYSFKFEAMDAYGNGVEETITFTVTKVGGPPGGETTGDPGGTTDVDPTGDDPTGDDPTADPAPTTGDGAGTDGDGPTGGPVTASDGEGMDADDGCGCRQPRGESAAALLLLLALAPVRRRRPGRGM